MNRIVSLLPSSTEIICALGCGERLVGRFHECDYPPEVGDRRRTRASGVAAVASLSELAGRAK